MTVKLAPKTTTTTHTLVGCNWDRNPATCDSLQLIVMVPEDQWYKCLAKTLMAQAFRKHIASANTKLRHGTVNQLKKYQSTSAPSGFFRCRRGLALSLRTPSGRGPHVQSRCCHQGCSRLVAKDTYATIVVPHPSCAILVRHLDSPLGPILPTRESFRHAIDTHGVVEFVHRKKEKENT